MKDNNNTNVVDFDLYRLRQTAADFSSEYEEDLYEDSDFGEVGFEIIFIPEEHPVNDNYPDTKNFETLLEFFLPETVSDYEKTFGNTFNDFTIEVWFNPETGEFEDTFSY
jgi:hypothetical protein